MLLSLQYLDTTLFYSEIMKHLKESECLNWHTNLFSRPSIKRIKAFFDKSKDSTNKDQDKSTTEEKENIQADKVDFFVKSVSWEYTCDVC